MCKHVAAVLYGVGARLDTKPELLFTLRGVNHEELIQADAEKAVAAATSRGKSKRLAAAEIGEVFGIELDPSDAGSSIEEAGVKETPPQANRASRTKAGRAPRGQSPKPEAKTARAAPKKAIKKTRVKKAKTQAA